MNETRHKFVESLKENDNLMIDGINYGRVFSCSMYDTSIKYGLKILVYTLFFNPFLEIKNKNADIILEYSLRYKKRKDLDQMFYELKNICKSCGEVGTILIDPKLSLKQVPNKLYKLIKLLKQSKSSEFRILDKIKINLLYIFYSEVAKILNSSFKKPKNKLFVSYFDGHNFDNLCAQHFNMKGILTLTSQHGQFRVAKEGFQNAESESYLNFISDYMLIWGDKTLDEFRKVGFDKNRFKIVGSLKKYKINPTESSGKAFGIILDGKINTNSNQKMIKIGKKIAKDKNLKYYLRLHPNDSLKKYNSLLDSNYVGLAPKDYYKNVKFSLLHMTGVFVEALSHAHPFFVMMDEVQEEIFIEEYNSFKDSSELLLKLNNFYTDERLFINKVKNLYSKFNRFEDINKSYSEVIKKLIAEQSA